jgi:hypothetical protein
MEQIEILLEKVQTHVNQHKLANPLSNRGSDAELPLADQLLLTLEYLKGYQTFVALGFSYGISESWANKVYHRIRPILAQVVGLKNPDKLRYGQVKRIVVDSLSRLVGMACQPIERPKKEQEKHYNRHKKNT